MDPGPFTFPKIHGFPPFYTKQQNSTVLENQLNEWCSLILAYCEHYRIFSLLPLGAAMGEQANISKPPLFKNNEVERTAPPELVKSIFNHLIHKLERGAYANPKQQDAGILVFWRTPEEWARILHDHVDKTGQLGSILTVYEMTLLDELAVDESFRNIDYNLLILVIDVLVKQGRAQVLRADDGSNRIEGVKIV